MPEVYVFANGERVVGLHADDVRVALGTLEWFGGEVVGGTQQPEDLLARAIVAALSNRAARESEARSGWRRLESTARIASDLESVRQRTAARAAVKGYGRFAIGSRLS